MALYVDKVSPEFIQKLADKYIKSYTTIASLAKQYKSSSGTISNILYRGVVESILDDVTAVTVVNKVVTSAYDLHQTDNRWKRAMKEREINKVNFELEYLRQKYEELKFQYETFDDYSIDEEDAPSKESLEHQLLRIENDIICLENYLKSLK